MNYSINDNGVDRPMTKTEIAYLEQSQKTIADDKAAQAATLDAKTAALESARKKLAALGLTADEIAAFFG